MSFKVSGRVYEAESGNGIPNLIIEAFDKDIIKNDKLGQVKSDSNGSFEITYSEADFKGKFDIFEGNPDLFILIKTPDMSKILYSSENNIRSNAKNNEYFDIAIPEATLLATKQRSSKDNKQLLKLLIGIAWIDGVIEPGEKEFLQRMANEKGLVDEPEIKSLLLLDKPVQQEECYEWLQAYLSNNSSDKDFQELYEAAAEDDGWLLTMVWDAVAKQSELLIIDAQNFTSEPVARVFMPQRVPYGFHATWISSLAMAS